MLLKRGADASLVNSDGKTPMDMSSDAICRALLSKAKHKEELKKGKPCLSSRPTRTPELCWAKEKNCMFSTQIEGVHCSPDRKVQAL